MLVPLFFSDAALVYGPGAEVSSIAYIEKLPYMALLSLAAASTLAALLLFRRRMLQLRLAAVACVLCLGLQGWIAWDYFTAPDAIVFRYTAVFPLVSAILDILAVRGIYADELMVRSASRLRPSRRRK